MAIDFHKWKAEPSGMHSHAEHGNEEALAILSRFVFVAEFTKAYSAKGPALGRIGCGP